MGKKDKKKGKGAEKTAAKTEKKAALKAKKELAAKGEDDIGALIAEFQERDKQQSFVGEERCPPPTQRSGFSFCAHPEKDELLLFGGEYFNGSKTAMYNDLYFYNIKKDQWSILHCSNKPPPRCSHQAVALSQQGGQMWIFGGEFASPSRSNFHHYKDLWVYHLAEQKWEQIKASGGPSARSGHRMALSRKRLVVFGGFHESIRDYKYFNDVHIFDLENYRWTKVEPSGIGPSPRSGCQMASLSDGRLLIYGGYSREKIKKDVDKGIAHTDMFYLQLDEKTSVPKWKWVPIRQTGIPPSPRSGFSIAVAPGNRAFFFGGVHDEEENDEILSGTFHNDMYALEMERGRWLPISFHVKSENTGRKRRRKAKTNEKGDDEEDDDSDVEPHFCIRDLCISDKSLSEEAQVEIKTSGDNVFTIKIEHPSSSHAASSSACSTPNVSESHPFIPPPRMNACLAIKHSVLYLYGGIVEDGDRQLTLSDFYSYDLHKLGEWKTIIASDVENLEWFDTEESSSEDEEGDECSDDNDSEVSAEKQELNSEVDGSVHCCKMHHSSSACIKRFGGRMLPQHGAQNTKKMDTT